MRTKRVFRQTWAVGLAAAFLIPACGDDGGGVIPDAMPAPDAPMVDANPPTAELMITPPSQDFGSVTIGSSSEASTFTITNNGDSDSGALTTTITGDAFAVDSDDCNGMALVPAASCEIVVVFSPDAEGAATGTLTVGDESATVSATLDGTGLAVGSLTISPTPHDFGNVTVGASASQEFTVSNDGDAESGTITASIGSGDATEFSITTDGCSGGTLAAGASCTISIDFTPASAGDKTTTLTVSDGVGDPATATLSGAGQDDAALEVNPVSGDFGTVTVDTQSSESTFTVTNTGDVASGTITTALGGTDASAFAITDDACHGQTLAADATCTIKVQFSPTDTGDKSASLDVSSDPGGAVNATLSGKSVAPGQLSIAPTPHDFGATLVAATGSSQTFTVTNTGGSATGTLATQVTDANASSFVIGSDSCDGQTLAAGATCTIEVTFAPQTAGSLSASLNVTATPGGNAQAGLRGTGLAPAALAIAPAQHNFGEVGLDDPETFSFTVTNNGDVDSGVPTVGFTTGEISQFQLSHNCSTALAGGESCTVDVTFDPSTQELHSTTLTVSANPGGSVNSLIEGLGVDSASLTFQSGGSITFDETVVDYQSTESTITVINNGDLDTGTIDVSIIGNDAAAFEIVADTCDGISLAAGGATCAIDVRFAPQSADLKSAAVSLTADPGSDIAAPLSGNALDKLLIVGETADDDGIFDTAIKVGNPATHTFNLVNNGEVRDLTVTIDPVDAGFVSVPDECLAIADGSSCPIDVTFTADENLTLHTATLTVTGDGANIDASAELALSATVEGALVIDDAAHDFGEVILGQAASHTFTITNAGGVPSGPIGVALETDVDFTVTDDQCAAGIDNGLSCTITVEFAPGVEGDLADTLTVSSDVGGATAALSGTGLTPADLLISGESFGDVIITDSDTVVFTVTNPGDVPAPNFATSRSGDPAFAVTGNDCDALVDLGPGASCNITVEFAPAAGSSPGERIGEILATADGGLSASQELVGEAISQLTVTPTSHTFDATVEGASSVAHTFTVENIGLQAVSSVATMAPVGDSDAFDVFNVDCTTLDPGAQCTFTITFTPPTAGNFSASVTASANAGATATVSVNGIGLVQATLEANPTSVDFGGVPAGAISDPETVTFTNTGDVATASLTVALDSSVDFEIVSDGCSGQTLAASASCDVSARFRPNGATGGEVVTTLDVGDGSTTVSVTLSGTANLD